MASKDAPGFHKEIERQNAKGKGDQANSDDQQQGNGLYKERQNKNREDNS
jgi:hypothetical protein